MALTVAAEAGWVDAARALPPTYRRLIHVPRLNPMQATAIPRVLGSDRNLVVASATGSGKTLVAEVALLKAVLARSLLRGPRTASSSLRSGPRGVGKGVYLVPMRAIAAEKRD